MTKVHCRERRLPAAVFFVVEEGRKFFCPLLGKNGDRVGDRYEMYKIDMVRAKISTGGG